MDFKFYRKSLLTETDIETSILEYLSFKGLAFKINQGGKPIFKDGSMIMIPFQSKFNPVGISDILFISKGKVYFFEVKKPKVKAHIEKFYSFYCKCDPKRLKDAKRIFAQQVQFIERVKKEGLIAGLISSIEDVEKFLI